MTQYTLLTSDAHTFEVDENVAFMSTTLRNVIEDNVHVQEIPILNVSVAALARVIEYCKYHCGVESNSSSSEWDGRFLAELDQSQLFDVLMASHYLDVQGLLTLAINGIANMLQSELERIPQEDAKIKFVQDCLGIKDDLSPTERELIKHQNDWAFGSP